MFETLLGAEMPLAIRFFLAFLIVLALIAVPVAIARLYKKSRASASASPPIQIARITEQVSFTLGGEIAVAMLNSVQHRSDSHLFCRHQHSATKRRVAQLGRLEHLVGYRSDHRTPQDLYCVSGRAANRATEPRFEPR